ncbi:hypothetical protein C8R47DRAFT_1067188 [Mycena vitilis]|nr:hypothetical protein C8R47DRAFT_1067188 [Mycena vitilis]
MSSLDPPGALLELETMVRDLQKTRLVSAVGLVILLYDHLLSLDDEVRFIWSAKYTSTKSVSASEARALQSKLTASAVQNSQDCLTFTYPFLCSCSSLSPSAESKCNAQLAAKSGIVLGDTQQILLGWLTFAINDWLVLLRLWVLFDRNRPFIIATMFFFVGSTTVVLVLSSIGFHAMLPVIPIHDGPRAVVEDYHTSANLQGPPRRGLPIFFACIAKAKAGINVLNTTMVLVVEPFLIFVTVFKYHLAKNRSVHPDVDESRSMNPSMIPPPPLYVDFMSLDALSTTLLSADDQDFIARIAALRSPEVTATHSGPPHLPTPEAIRDHFSRLIASWIPHPFTSQERRDAQLDCLRYLTIARQIEQVKKDIHPRPLPEEVAAQLLFARQSHRIRYFRLFRVNDLPTEIITNVLRYVVWDSMKRPVKARLHVTWTCRRWREIALADATLWNAIWFRGSGAAMSDRAWAWFERAQRSPLDVRIDGDGPSGSPFDDELDSDSTTVELSDKRSMAATAMRELLVRLFTKLATIRMLIVVVEDWESALPVLDLLTVKGPSGVPVLKRFELHRGGLKTEDRRTLAWPGITSQPFLGGAVAPSLEYLSLNGVSVDWSGSVLRNLTTLDIRRLPTSHSPNASRFREILNDCPRLNKLSMDGAGPVLQEESSEDIVPVHLPYLRTLVIADFSCPYLLLLFTQFSAPDVNDLTLMNLCGDDYLPVFLKITPAFPKVRLLTAYSIQFDSSPHGLASMTGWLDSMPLLTYLRVANVANQFFGIFFRPHAVRTPVAPRLAFVDCQSIEPVILVQWAKDRAKFGTPLRRIYISEELQARLQKDQVLLLTTLCTLVKLPRGATTPEEEELSL